MDDIPISKKKPSIWGDISALVAGLLLPFAFSPFEIYWIAIVSPAILLLTWTKVSPRRAFWRGWLFGLGFFGVGASWVYTSIYTYGQAPHWVAILITGFFITFLSLFSAVQGYLLTRFFPKNILSKYLLAFPASWVLFEWLREWALTGFPWLYLGYSQMASPLRGLAPIVGVYGVSWAVAFSSGLLVALASQKQRKIKFLFLILALVLWFGSSLLAKITWTQPTESIKVSMIQGNIPQELKWSPEQIQNTLDIYQELTEQHWDSQIIIWPEAAITIWQFQAQPYLEGIGKAAQSHHSTIITGIPVMLKDQYYNGMIAVGSNEAMYLKRHLVPFGEFMPLKSVLLWLRNYVQIPMSDFNAGAYRQKDFKVNNIIIAPFICYEIAYSKLVLDSFPQAQLIVVVTDDSWFGKSLAPAQHLQIAQMRALETGRYLLMSTNDGVTAIINPQGKIAQFAEPFTRTVLTATIQAMSGTTPIMSIGVYFIIIVICLILLLAFVLQRFVKK